MNFRRVVVVPLRHVRVTFWLRRRAGGGSEAHRRIVYFHISTSSLFVDIAFKVMEFISIPAIPSVPSFSVVKKLAMHASKHIHHVVVKAHTLPMYEPCGVHAYEQFLTKVKTAA